MRIMTLIEFVFDRYKRKDVSKKTINWNCIAFGMAMKKDWGNKSVCNVPLIKKRIDFFVHVKSLHTFSYNLVTVKSHSGFVFFHSTLSIFCFMHPCQQLLVSPWQLKTIHTHVCSQIAWCGPNKKKQGRCLAFCTWFCVDTRNCSSCRVDVVVVTINYSQIDNNSLSCEFWHMV